MATRRRGRKPAKFDSKLKLERSQQSARECRARKKLRYQYLEELVASREKAIIVLRKELDAVYVLKQNNASYCDTLLVYNYCHDVTVHALDSVCWYTVYYTFIHSHTVLFIYYFAI